MLRRSHILFFICVLGFVLCLTNGFADDDGAILEGNFEFPTADGPEYIQGTPEFQRAPESIFGTADFEKMRDLPTDSQDHSLGTKVGLLAIPRRDDPDYFFTCTGFLVGPDLFMTNHHCIPDRSGPLPLGGTRIYMDYYQEPSVDRTRGGITVGVSKVLRADARKDYALLLLDKPIGYTYGWLKLDTTTQVDTSQSVKIIQHPDGRSKEIARRNSQIVDIPTDLINRYPFLLGYLADTQGGSSGSPVFLRDGTDVIAIHHSGYRSRRTGEPVVNAGTLMSSIVPEIQQWLVLPKFTSRIIANQGFPVDVLITPLTLPAAIFGTAPYTYSFSPIPAGLSFTQASRTLSGIPTKIGTTNVTYTATDANQQTATLNFAIRVIGPLALDPSTFANQTFPLDAPITPLTLPAAIDGTAPYTYTYSFSPIPAGLQFDKATRGLSGTPTKVGTTKVTYTATDTSRQTASLNFTIRVIHVPLSSFNPSTFANQTFPVDVPITPLTLPLITGGTPPYTYTLSPIPAGLSFTAASRRFSGTPTKVGTTNVIYAAADASRQTASFNFTIRVIGPLALDPSTFANQTFPADVPITPLALPAATGGTPPYTYTLSPISAGLSFTPASRTLSGTPTTAGATKATYTATDVNQQTASLNFTVRVIAPLTLNPSTIANQTFTAGTAIQVTLPIATGGTAPYTYALSPIPAGLQFDTTTRVLSGTPTTPTSATPTIYTATDATNASESLRFTMTVIDATPASITFSPSTIADQTFTVGDPVNLTLPIATGGTAPYTYSLSPIPAGLQFDTTTRVLSGTPTTPTSATPTTYTATDATNASESLRFMITVIDATPAAITLTPSIIANQTFTVDVLITPLALPAATGGTAPYTYALSPIPAGLSFTQASRTLSGTPTTAGTTNVTYTATDASRQTASLNFTIRVITPLTFNPHTIIADQVFPVDVLITPLTLPIATGGTAPYTYALSPIPAGLSFTQASRTLSGTPTTAGTTNVTYTATDASRQTASLNFTIRVITPLTFNPSTIVDQTFVANTPIVPLDLPVALGGTPPYTYTLEPLLNGLVFDASNRTLSGTPTVLAPATSVTYTATDATNASTALTFTIEVTVDTTLDVNADGHVTVVDLAIVALFYGIQVVAGVDLAADVNDDGSVDILDLTAVAQAIEVSAGNNSALSADDVEAVLEAIADIEGIAEAPARFSRGNRVTQFSLRAGVVYRNVAAAFKDAKHLATGDARLGKWMPLLKELLHLLTEMREIPNTTALLPNYPNPFNPETWIPYHLSTPAEVTLSIYSVDGRLVRALEIGHQAAGVYESRARAAYWDGRNSVGEPVASGIYFYTLTVGALTATRKMLIRK